MTASQFIAETTQKVADAIASHEAHFLSKYEVAVHDEGGGPYISLTAPGDDDDYRCLALADGGYLGDDLMAYRWTFWNPNLGTSENSEFRATATAAQVTAFLSYQLGCESVVIARGRQTVGL